MPIRLVRPAAALALLAALWGLDSIRGGRPLPEAGTPATNGHVRILRFYATTGMVMPGEPALLCYGVENARSVSISPDVRDVYPSKNHCLETTPQSTTSYTLVAEGYDGTIDARTLTLPVHPEQPARSKDLDVALMVF